LKFSDFSGWTGALKRCARRFGNAPLPRCAACTPEETPPEVAVGGEGISLLQSFCTALHIARVILCRK
jgi:hypothetical protein